MMHSNLKRCLLTLAAATAVATAGLAQSKARPLAIRNARILTLSGETIENGTVLVKVGKIKAVGKTKDVDIPAGAEVLDARGGTVMPGLVHAFSRAGTRGARSGGAPQNSRRRRFRSRGSSSGSAANKAGTKLADSLYARQEIFADLLGKGVTTMVIAPSGGGVSGQAVQVDPTAEYEDGFILDDDIFLTMNVEAKSQSKNVFKSAIGSGKKALEARKKAIEDAKKAEEAEKKKAEDAKKKAAEDAKKAKEAGDTPKGGEEKPKADDKPKGGGDRPKGDRPKPKGEQPAEKPAPKKGKAGGDKGKKDDSKKKRERPKDPNAEALADLLDGKRRAFVEINSAKDMLHYQKALGDNSFRTTIVTRQHSGYDGTLDKVIEQIQELEASVLITPQLTSGLYSNALFDPSAKLREAGIEVGYLLGDSKQSIYSLFFQLTELVRYGAKPEDVLRGVTAIPAKMLGLSRQVGTVEAGKKANLLLFSGDPLDPTSRLLEVIHDGERVQQEANR